MSRIHIHHQRDEYALVEQRDRHRYTGLEWEVLEPNIARMMWPFFRTAITSHFDAQGIHGGQSVRLLSISTSSGNLTESLRLATRQSELPRSLALGWTMFRKVMMGYRFDPRPDPTDTLVPKPAETPTDWIEVAVLDSDGNALDDSTYTYKYEFLLTNGQTLTGDIVLENGNIKVPDLASGLCEFKITRTPKS